MTVNIDGTPPAIGKKRLNKLNGVDVRNLLKRVRGTCLCCLHGTDRRRPVKQRRCCAVGRCCHQAPSARLVQPGPQRSA